MQPSKEPGLTKQATTRASDCTPHPLLRKDLDRPLTVLKVQNGTPRTFFGYAHNISASGMRIAATSPRDPGSRYLLEIPFPETPSGMTECRCEVVWKRDYSKGDRLGPGMGLRFLDLPDEVALALDAWIRNEAFRDRLRVVPAC